MEPNDPQLRDLLREWQTPPVPRSLEERAVPPRSWARFLLHGYVRVPMPAVYCLLALMLLAGWKVAARPAQTAPCAASCNNPIAGAC
jgi:hypothetical protein